MAYLKFSRDKRGYENFYLVQPSNRGKSRPRVLYWFRTPPGVRVGRTPFDPDMRRALETQNPDVTFDWDAIVQTPIPPPAEPERWRERRRVERAFRASESEESASTGEADGGIRPAAAELTDAGSANPTVTVEAGQMEPAEELVAASNLPSTVAPSTVAAAGTTGAAEAPAGVGDGAAGEGQQVQHAQQPQGARRRRRRRGRRKPQVGGPPVPALESEGSTSQDTAIQDSEEPDDDKLEP